MTLSNGEFVDIEKRYSIVKELGRGGMATVYEVVDHTSNNHRRVALKIANSEPHIRETSRKHLESEYAIAKQIKCPQVVEVFEIGESLHGAPFFTMALTPGKTLAEIIKTRKETNWFALSEIYALLIQIAEALVAVNASGMVYADLKPSNIIVDENEGALKCTLIDFGIASRSVPFSSTDKTLTESTSSGMTGTSLYMSPEQIRGFPLTVRSDIYSFGMVAFELCTSKLPLNDEGLFSVTASHLMKRIPPVNEVRPEIPKNLSLLIQVTLEKQPRDRYSNLEEVLDRLREFSTNSDTESSPSFSRFFSTLFGRLGS